MRVTWSEQRPESSRALAAPGVHHGFGPMSYLKILGLGLAEGLLSLNYIGS